MNKSLIGLEPKEGCADVFIQSNLQKGLFN